MGGPGQSLNTQNQITQQELGIASQQNQLQGENYQRMLNLQQPEIAKETALASGDPNAALAASQPVISQVSGGYDAAKQGIFNRVAPGAARDKALADLEVQKATTVSGAQANLIQQAPEKLANIGAGLGSFSLQELGASINSLGGASSSNQSVMSAEEQSKASTMGFLGSLAGGAGSALAGSFKLSDKRMKNNITPMEDSLDAINDIQIVNFDYVSGIKDQSGVIAQQILPFMPEAVVTQPNGMYLVDYSRIAMMAIKALQELTARVESLELELASREQQDAFIESGEHA